MAGFDDVLERFWDTRQTHDVHPPLTPAAISDAERILGVRLPADYLALMRVQNGGLVSADLDGHALRPPCKYPSGHLSDYVQITGLNGLGGEGVDCHLQRSEDW